jgi:hypothetical protein
MGVLGWHERTGGASPVWAARPAGEDGNQKPAAGATREVVAPHLVPQAITSRNRIAPAKASWQKIANIICSRAGHHAGRETDYCP